ncbi:uncharacterized protein LOC128221017 isoform X1 [Mya arenaria]|uniref:uncharacterized protein LOC128221017 isoform X1 n=1 Tax=Mya arenaria TaxID=6604 RepID=UPI0022E50CD6|nr:uncharacterized protein LOC128221017 isoform X1 [Mya arenaria]
MAVEHCFVGKHFPATIQSIINAQFTYQNAMDYWTGIIKTESITSLSSMLDNRTNSPVTYAYVEQINKTLNVRFANEGESRKSLCAGGKDGTSQLPATTTRESQPTYSVSTTTQVTISKGGTSRISTITTRETESSYLRSTTTQVKSRKDDTSATPSISAETQLSTFSTSITTEVESAKGPSTLIAVGVSIAVIHLVAVVLAVMIWRKGMLRTCFKNTVIEKTTAEVSTAVANQQRVEYVNTTSDGMHRNTKDTRDAQTYEKLNMTTSSDNYLSIQEIDADRHFYQNT